MADKISSLILIRNSKNVLSPSSSTENHMVDSSPLPDSMEGCTMEETLEIMEPNPKKSIGVNTSEAFETLIQVEFPQVATQSKNPEVDAPSKTLKELDSPTPLNSNPILVNYYRMIFHLKN